MKMERVFWVECPGCQGRFYCHFDEMRHAGVQLICPFCRRRFLPDEAADVDDRWDDRDLKAAPGQG